MKKSSLYEVRRRRLSVIVSAFADSVAERDFDGAEGWFSLACDQADREDPRRSRDQISGETNRIRG